jgi:hypothetical protein
MNIPSAMTKFGVLPIFRKDGKLVPLPAIEARSAEEAMSKTVLIASVVGGAIAFMKTGDGPTRILECSGEVPEGFKASSDSKALEPSLPRKILEGIASAAGASASRIASIASSAAAIGKASPTAIVGKVAAHDAKAVKLASELNAMLAQP